MPNLFIVTNNIGLKWTTWKIYDRCEIHILLIEVFFVKSLQSLFLDNQIVVIDVAINTARSETCIIFKPINAANSIYMTLALIVLGAIFCIEIVHPNSIGSISTSKEMATIAKLDFFASLDLKSARLGGEFLTKHIID
jgi:hypothetical protein